MSEVTKYYYCPEEGFFIDQTMAPAEEGHYVHRGDYEKLKTELIECKAQIDAVEWIPVKERLPKCGSPKPKDLGWLVYRPKSKRKIWVETAHPDWWSSDNGSSQEITHWMPLPSQPKGEKQ